MNALDQAEGYLAHAKLLDASGAVLYSGGKSLRKSPVYLLGLNPGGEHGATLRESIAATRKDHNAYTDEPWGNRRASYAKGQAPLQLRVTALCKQMGLEVREVPASNLVFTRSPSVGEHLGYNDALKLCLPVHRIFMDVIQPKFLMTFGRLTFFERAADEMEVESREARYGNWNAHRGRVRFLGHDIGFGNVPHLSYWDNRSRIDVVEWVLKDMRC